MTKDSDKNPAPATLSAAAIDLGIRLGLLSLLGYWSFKVIAPFLTIVLWSAILAVALYPLFDWLALRLGHRRMAAALVTVLCLIIVVGPVTWLGFGLIDGVGSLVRELDSGQLSIPPPADFVKAWPFVGERVYQLWSHVAADIKEALVEVAPRLRPVGGKLVEIAQNAFLGLLQFLVSIIIAGFLFLPGPRLVDALSDLLGRVLSRRGEEMVRLAGATIRNIARGVVGVALLQSFLAGVGFLVAGIPAASVFAFLALVLGIVQIGPAILLIPIVFWSWTTMETANALIFTGYMIPVSLIDNVLKPILMARGLTTPIPVIMIGVIGGTIAYGIVGLFFGPIILSVAWAVIVAWVQEGNAIAGENRSK